MAEIEKGKEEKTKEKKRKGKVEGMSLRKQMMQWEERIRMK